MSTSSADTVRHGKLARWTKLYRDAAVICFNFLILFILLNVFLYVVFSLRGPEPGTLGGKPPPISAEILAKLYPVLSPADRSQLLRECWTRPYVYQDYLMFKERPFRGKYVNVSEAGYRHVKNQGPWPPVSTNLNVFVFGGSTAFGYGVEDDQTIASHFQQALSGHSDKRVCVYNFGTGWYYSTQERLLFEKLLSDGFIPHVAVFVDGMNDSTCMYDSLAFSPKLGKLFEEANYPGGLGGLAVSFIDKLPMGRAIRGARRRLARPAPGALEKAADEAVRKYRQNMVLIEAVCRQFSITPVFVWQPAPGYKYDLQFHLFPPLGCYRQYAYAYGDMAKLAAADGLGSHFVWAADLQENEKEHLYVDGVHYNGKLCRKVAERIVQTALQHQWFTPHGVKSAAP